MQSEPGRRSHLEKMIPGELAIREALIVVEAHGCHPQLTEVVSMLSDAQRKLADWYDSGAPGAPPSVSLIDAVARDPNVSDSFKAAVLTAK
jgi:hypothetical protein